jgi:hypothetical protein
MATTGDVGICAAHSARAPSLLSVRQDFASLTDRVVFSQPGAAMRQGVLGMAEHGILLA